MRGHAAAFRSGGHRQRQLWRAVAPADDPLQPNTWLYQVGPRPANPPTATCDLRVTAAPTAGTAAIPTLSEWALIVMALVAAAVGLGALRHKRI
ncbi:IPTL-CTERM sorting domain-containing protein [Acidovorax sp. LjRoot117]|uniref:IPTL-CTERM sorting domain-containing protein n=1 Tax=Acidovorax sp. LjRoot117 TaxID=3342255 RepID=UPI003ECEC9F1